MLGSSADVLYGLRAHERVPVRPYERRGRLWMPADLANGLRPALRRRHPYRDNRFERQVAAAEGVVPCQLQVKQTHVVDNAAR